MGRRWTENENKFIKEHFGSLTYQEIGNLIERTKSSVMNQARKLGLTSKGLGKNPLSTRRKYKINDSIFNEINNTNAYLAGFIAADGCISGNKVRIGLQIGDIKYLQKIKDLFSYDGKIYLYSSACSLEMTSEEIVMDLKEKFNIVERKSLTLKPPILEERNHILSFIKGYIDGDGSIYYTNNRGYKYLTLSVIGTEAMCSFIKKEFEDILVAETPKLQQRANVYHYRINGKQAEKVYKFLKHEVKTPALERKWKKEL